MLLVAFLLLCAPIKWAACAEGPHGSVELLAAQAAVQPGQPFWVGLHFQIEPGWHIYWINPGDSGEPPRVKWSLPAGFQAGPLQWPVPHRIEDHSLMDYGYEGQILFPVEISPPAQQSGGHDVQIGAAVNWLVCREICVPEQATLALTLPIRTNLPPPERLPFFRTHALMPLPAPASWTQAATLDERSFVLKIITGEQEKAATFFPLTPNQIENAAPQKATPLPQGIQLELRRSDQLLKAPARLAGVLVLATGKGYHIDASVVASK